MEATLQQLEPGLASCLRTLADCVEAIQGVLRSQIGCSGAGLATSNTFGDTQLAVDVHIDQLIFAQLAACPACCAASSEEQPDIHDMGAPPQGAGYTVVFDPLDGSSIVGAGFAVGSIFGVYPGSGVTGRCGRDQAAAAYALYGPRTLLVWARPATGDAGPLVVEQWVLGAAGSWSLLPFTGYRASGQEASGADPAQTPVTVVAPSKPLFAPANMRCCADNAVYQQLINSWVQQGFTLRYTGGMVPDVHHILAKGGGVFCNPASSKAPAKLRLVYECAPMALILEAAGGASHDGQGSVLDVRIASTTQRSAIALGSTGLVHDSIPALKAGLTC